jgi:hypothetical protein
MQHITDEQLAKFKALYKKHFGEELTEQDALDKAIKLVRIMEIVYKPMTIERYNQVQESRKRLRMDKDQ